MKKVDPAIASQITAMENTLKSLKEGVGMTDQKEELGVVKKTLYFGKGIFGSIGRKVTHTVNSVVQEQAMYEKFKEERDGLLDQATEQVDNELIRRHGSHAKPA